MESEIKDINSGPILFIQSEVLSLKGLMALSGWSKNYIYKLTSKGIIPYYKPNGKTIFFKKSEIEDYLLTNKIQSKHQISKDAAKYVNRNRAKLGMI